MKRTRGLSGALCGVLFTSILGTGVASADTTPRELDISIPFNQTIMVASPRPGEVFHIRVDEPTRTPAEFANENFRDHVRTFSLQKPVPCRLGALRFTRTDQQTLKLGPLGYQKLDVGAKKGSFSVRGDLSQDGSVILDSVLEEGRCVNHVVAHYFPGDTLVVAGRGKMRVMRISPAPGVLNTARTLLGTGAPQLLGAPRGEAVVEFSPAPKQ